LELIDELLLKNEELLKSLTDIEFGRYLSDPAPAVPLTPFETKTIDEIMQSILEDLPPLPPAAPFLPRVENNDAIRETKPIINGLPGNLFNINDNKKLIHDNKKQAEPKISDKQLRALNKKHLLMMLRDLEKELAREKEEKENLLLAYRLIAV